MTRVRSWWGWGFEDAAVDPAALAPMVTEVLGFALDGDVLDPVPIEQVAVPAPRLALPTTAGWSTDPRDRLGHAQGKAFRDIARAVRGRVDHVPDAVVFARDEDVVGEVLAWAAQEGAVVVPYGGGTSVVGGLEPRDGRPWVSLDLSGLDRLLDVDAVSRAARIQGGASGPRLEAQLAEHGLTMRFFPQSFELSTLGGWIATRAGGHFATVWTHVDDLVEAVRAVTPSGVWESTRLPGSGAGPSPDRLLLGSEGILGAITEAWVRVQPKPEHRAQRAVRFASFLRGADAVRAISQAALHPSACRLLDPLEAVQAGAGDGTQAVLVLGFESTDHDVEDALGRALALCRAHGGEPDPPRARGAADDSVGAWRDAFIAMPYLRDALLRLGIVSETFETAVTWDRLPALHDEVVGAVREALGEPCRVTCRFTHVYPDGPAPYFTVLAPAVRGGEVEQWDRAKAAASEALHRAGGTITHHHAVGRDHRPWYDRQRPEPFAAALRAAKAALDPAGVLNPGVLVDP
ncbi:FAD-binding oxidoreductase [Conexibacter sp. SYSU D00693]|uniref:FAD-binding oxidoreductase n=1 Tax=Conexibacter sp. SYSU D00693 TaxID=2812560 RepID=UPI00196A9C71|nr:FAD-binding oxidoreductase [Conexibacter sp. SYSU D00693]